MEKVHKIEEYREYFGLSVVNLCEIIGISRTLWYDWVEGKKTPTNNLYNVNGLDNLINVFDKLVKDGILPIKSKSTVNLKLNDKTTRTKTINIIKSSLGV